MEGRRLAEQPSVTTADVKKLTSSAMGEVLKFL
jgi:hypothetical protein